MVDQEQGGVSSASAGGAPAPILDLSAFEKAGRLLAAAWLEQQAARAAYWRGLFGGLSANQEPHAIQEVDRSTCPNCWGDLLPDPRDAEIERLRGELAKANSGWETWREERRAHDKRRDNELRVVAERLHDLIGDTEPCAMAFISTRHLHSLLDRGKERAERDLERANEQAIKATNERNEARTERDRLRQELDLVGEQHAAGLVTLRTDFTAAVNGLLPKLAEPNRQGCPCKSQCDYLDGEDRCSDSCDCAAGRRWVAGDPEPEIGTLITWGSAGSAWERHGNGWKTAVCQCKKCSSTIGLTWPDLLAYAPLVEVVTSDG